VLGSQVVVTRTVDDGFFNGEQDTNVGVLSLSDVPDFRDTCASFALENPLFIVRVCR
jgi:hypothetical protein